ncbi:MAG: S9 family peptidase, partial [Acidobacteria bacterium]|nr:S9 family peptidase [Acidobacteriota bacterium]
MLKRHRAALAVLLILALPAVARSAPPTLEEIMSSPFPSALRAAPRSPKVAWVFNDRGGRDIWVAEGPDYVGRAVTELTADDGQAITSLAWSPGGRRIAFVRGGSANASGELPNPKKNPQGVEQAIYVVSLSDDETHRIDDGRGPLFSADGETLLYLKKGKIWTAPLSRSRRGVSREPAQLIHGRGSFGSLELSPDGTRLAFVSDRGEYSFVGIYDFRSRRLRYLDPGVDRDISPAWSPDGSTVAFIRLPARLGTRIFGPVREGPPWSIRLADASVANGSPGVELWRAESGAGSVFRAVVADSQLFWTEDAHLIFPWELDGWTHHYAFEPVGGAPRLMTPGAFEV